MKQPGRPRRVLDGMAMSFRSVRGRVTLLAVAVVGVVLIASAVALVAFQRRALTDNVETTIQLRADDIESQIRSGALPATLAAADDEVAVVQVLRDGQVVAATPNVRGPGPVIDVQPAAGSTVMRKATLLEIDEDPFRVLARSVETSEGRFTIYVASSLDDVSESTSALVGFLQIGIPLLLLGVGVGAWFVTGRALSPVEDIRREVEGISERGLDRRVPEPALRDEVGRLAVTMNAMLERLEAAYRRQEQFVADAAHELRSPLASLRTQLEVAGSSEDLLAEVVRLQNLTDNLLLLAGVDADRALSKESIDLDDVVLEEVRRIRLGTNGRVTFDASGVSAGAVRGDAPALGRAVRNLLDNAARHARGSVRVELQEAEGVVTLAVADDGEGIPAGSTELIFERFARLDEGRARSAGGAGLGLAIVRSVVEAYGGTVRVDAEHSPGARFVVELPSAG